MKTMTKVGRVMKSIPFALTGFLVVLVAAVALPGTPAHAATTYVVTKTADTNDGACNGDCSLREAIVAANANAGADTITLPAGTYLRTIGGAGENAAATGDLDVLDSLTIDGAGAATTIIDGNGLDRVFHVAGAITVGISGVTVRGGAATGVTGGGIHNIGALTLTNAIVQANAAAFGAGIYQSGGSLILNGSTVSGNTAPLEGGGINNDLGTVTLIGGTISGNSGSSGGGVYSTGTLISSGSTIANNNASNHGGGITNSGIAMLTSSVVSGNAATNDGGGIYSTGALTMDSSTVNGNTDNNFGGGIHNFGGTATLNSSTVSGNSAFFGAGILNQGGTATLNSSTVSGNIANFGGGIYNYTGAAVTLNSSTVSGNAALNGGGIFNDNGTAAFENTIAANSVSGGNCIGDPVTSSGYNLSSDATCAFTATGDMKNTDPRLGPLAFNGGPTPTHVLLDGSPAADAGTIPCPPPATDQRGVSRPQGFRCDIGAYEAPDGDGDGVSDPLDTDDDNDGVPDSSESPGCRTRAEDYDAFQDTDGCPDPDNDSDGVCDSGQVSISCTGSDAGKYCFDPAGTISCGTFDCRNVAEDVDAFKDTDGCPEPDNDNDGKLDAADVCPGTNAHAGADGMLGSPQDLNHNGVRDIATEAVFTLDDGVQVFEDYDGVLDADGCHDSPGADFDGDGYTDDNEALKIGTDPGYPCGIAGWPSDVFSSGASSNKLDVQDIISFVAPTRRLDRSPPSTAYDARWDLTPGPNSPFTNYINIIDITTELSGTVSPASPAYPPMLGGQRAFGKACPLP